MEIISITLHRFNFMLLLNRIANVTEQLVLRVSLNVVCMQWAHKCETLF